MLLGLLKASESKLAKSDDSTTAPTMTSAPSGNSAPSSSRGKGASVESPPSDFYPRTKGKKSKGGEKMKKSKSEGASKSRIKNSKKSKKSRSKKGEESMTPTSPGKYPIIEYLLSGIPFLMLADLIVLSSFCFCF